uniref:Uncharacterized protein n=1 Tax=Anguilla anguilla TaxID=7936 RepID=A0A0E9UL90_ANGAN
MLCVKSTITTLCNRNQIYFFILTVLHQK